MIKAVEENKVSTVIVKDMSRFGRDYLKVGFYTEILFKEKGVRFIAINNGIDSEKTSRKRLYPISKHYERMVCKGYLKKNTIYLQSKNGRR